MHTIKAAPFIKWAGGKYQLAEKIIREAQKHIDFHSKKTYIEPFLGGGGVFFYINQLFHFDRKIISDINPELINTYLHIKNDFPALIKHLEKIENHFNRLTSDEDKKNFYLAMRENYNDKLSQKILDAEQAAFFIGLNKLGFNGLYRVNSKGLFNVPFGKKKTANLFNGKNLFAVHQILQDTEIYCQDYSGILKYIDQNTVVYFDSPYRPITETAAFTAYTQGCFNDNDQQKLAAVAAEITKKGGSFFLSNSDPTQINQNDLFFDNLYQNFMIKRIEARRAIAAIGDKRGMVTEILVVSI